MGAPGANIAYTDLDFSEAPGFGSPGSGEPVIVELLRPDGAVIEPPIDVELTSPMMVRLSTDASVAENGATYGPATISVLGEPYTP